jgi:hypothetical protein
MNTQVVTKLTNNENYFPSSVGVSCRVLLAEDDSFVQDPTLQTPASMRNHFFLS